MATTDYEALVKQYDVRPDVMTVDDIVADVPRLAKLRPLLKGLFSMLSLNKVNAIHARHASTPGVAFCTGVLEELDMKLRVDNSQVLDNLPDGAFITVSNHPFGAVDGIMLIHLIGSHRPDFKVMVNMILNKISAMRPNFIAVDALASDDPKKKAVSMHGIKEAIMQVRGGHPIGFFPAGAVSKINSHFELEDREWQPNIIRLIAQLKVPVIPIYFHGSNSWWFNLLGRISWQLRTLRLPAEVFNKKHKNMHISVGNPISVEEIVIRSSNLDELGRYLKDATYSMRKWK
ncbi:MAG: hypothetical protein HDS08_06450 [Bacteroides sp.]|nr:hypothetical protein [Bacteroides sp.]